MNIRYLKNSEINYYRWDICIKNSFNSSIYGYTWYLNTVCENWDALIEGEYETLMPIPTARILGLPGIKTPAFTSSLGIFSTGLISQDKVETFFRAIPSKFLFINLAINKFNKVNRISPAVTNKSHFELDLIKTYSKIFREYDHRLKEKLATAGKQKLNYLKAISPNEMLELIKTKAGGNIRHLLNPDKSRALRMLISTSTRYKLAELAGVYNSFNKLVCAAFFVWSGNNVILLFCHTINEGLREHALCFLIDQFIQQNSNRFITLIFDYFGLPGLNDIYRQFGAIESQYHQIKKIRLPFLSSFPGGI